MIEWRAGPAAAGAGEGAGPAAAQQGAYAATPLGRAACASALQLEEAMAILVRWSGHSEATQPLRGLGRLCAIA